MEEDKVPLFSDDDDYYREDVEEVRSIQPLPQTGVEELVTLDYQPAFQAFPVAREPQLAYLLLLIRTAARISEPNRQPLNLCLVVDQSSSMRGDKLFALKNAARQVVDQLTTNDFFSLISFNDRPTTVVQCARITSREAVKAQIDTIEAKGGTELAKGLLAGIQEMKPGTASTSLNHMILLTDGQTYGDADRCVKLGEEAARFKIVIHPMGIGADWNEDLLETVASKTGSNSDFIEQPDQIVKIFMHKVAQVRSTLASNSAIYMRPVQGVQIKGAHRIIPSIAEIPLTQLEDNTIQLNFGTLGKAAEYGILLELVLPPCPAGTYRMADMQLSYFSPTNGQTQYSSNLPIGLNFVDSPKPQAISSEVKAIIEKVTAFKMQARAWNEIAQGDIASGTKRLAAVSTRLLSMGEVDLASQVQREVENLESRGTTSAQGKKRIKYGTRGLTGQL
jgi:Ca-activated chloride channel homolog